MAEANENEIPQHRSCTDSITLTRAQVLVGIATYSRPDQDNLIWLHGWAADELNGSRCRLTEELKVDWTTIWRVWSGKYGADITTFMGRVARLRKRTEASRRKRFVPTVVTDRIFQLCDVARDRSTMVMISGPTGRSKTWTLLEWKHRNNHGRAVMVYALEYGGFRAFVESIARALNIGVSGNIYNLTRSIENSLDERNILIIDEVAHLYPTGKAGSIQGLEFIRGLHDRCHCGVVLSCTEGLPQMITRGRWGVWFDQLLGRIELHLKIPKNFSRQEVAELLGAYIEDPDPALVSAAREIANKSTRGCRDLFRHLDRTAQVAEDLGVALSDALLRKTVEKSETVLQLPTEK